MCLYTYYLLLPRVSRAEGGSEGGGAGLAVPWHVAGLRGAADGQGVNAVRVAVTVTAVLLPATITRSPDKDGAQSAASLWCRNIHLYVAGVQEQTRLRGRSYQELVQV